MAKTGEDDSGWRGNPWRIAGWGTAALLLLVPLVAKAPWSAADFILAGVVLGGVGLAFELIVRKSGSLAYRMGAALAVVAAILTVSINGAVGMIGSEDNPYNLLFLGVPLVALGGAVAARFEPAGVARAMVVAALAQAMVGGFGLATDLRGSILSVAFAWLWLLSALLIRKAERAPTLMDPAR